MTTTFKFADHRSAQCHIEHDLDNETLTLVSYYTPVATIKTDLNGDRWLTVNGLYSMTTRKHIGWFMREFTPFQYATAKACYENNLKLCLDTGEVVDL